ncbi:MAG: DUF4271 domain-containing protein [Bacteroidetes bacterium]|nr:DUF4271 domain-containing protein [Bacteroidota bacterium]
MPFLKTCLTILFFFIAGNIFSQTDTALQRMIEEAKVKAAQQKNNPSPVKKDTNLPAKPPRPAKKDSSVQNAGKEQTLITPVLNDSPEMVIQDTFKQIAGDSVTLKSMPLSPQETTNKNNLISWKQDTAFIRLFTLPGLLKPSLMPLHEGDFRKTGSQDYLLYLFLGLLLYLGIINRTFQGYIKKVFQILFFKSQRYKQSREMAMQDTVPSLLLNILFFVVVGLWITISIQDISLFHFSFAQKFVAAIALVAIIYCFKAIMIFLIGAIFHKQDAAGAYTQIVFHVNKVMGIFLLPLAILYTYGGGNQKALILSFLFAMVILLMLYRYIVTFLDITGRFKINGLYFFIYICVTEVLPMMILFEIIPGIITKYA